jgi:hypothetical protein
MGIRVRPLEIEIPKADPFKNDLLNRKEPAEILTQLIDAIEGPCVLAIDAAWGAGKTTFLKMWSQHLCDERFPVVEFNAWETDHAGDPFVAIVAELTEGLRGFADESLTEKIRDTAEAAKHVALRAIPGAIRILTAGVLDVQQLIEKEAGKLLASYAEGRLKNYTEAKDSIEVFRNKLQEMAKSLAASKSHPLIVMVDELDRCRPSYAVELIEVAKHLFAVDHTVFVLAVNRDQLAHSIRALYGNDFDATGYLRRFFDIDFRLPDPDRKPLIRTMLNSVKITGDICDLLEGFFVSPSVSLRQIGQVIYRIGLVVASLNSTYFSALATGAAVILRTADDNIYRRFVNGMMSDLEVADAIFEHYGISKAQKEGGASSGARLFEAILVMAAAEISSRGRQVDWSSLGSPLFERYHGLSPKTDSGAAQQDPEVSYAARVIQTVNQLGRRAGPFAEIGFMEAVKRIELLEPSDWR